MKSERLNLNKQQCLICTQLREDVEIMCEGNHTYCGECINQHYEYSLMNKETINNKCTLCSGTFYENKLKTILSDDIKSSLTKCNIYKDIQVPNNLSILKCPLCVDTLNPGLILLNRYDHAQFYKCDKERCGKEVCLYCYNESENNKAKHEECKLYYEIMIKLEKVVESAILKQCPKCVGKVLCDQDTPRLKDGSCTHIRCNKCNLNYCYICGGHENTVDKSLAVGKAAIYRHNDEWEKNNNRCPMYVRDFSRYILGWPLDENQASIKLEEYKIKSYIEKIVKRYKFDKVKKAYQIFSSKRLCQLSKDYFDREEDYSHFVKIDLIEKKVFSQFTL